FFEFLLSKIAKEIIIKTIIIENKPICLKHLLKFLNAIKEQKEQINIIRNNNQITNYEETVGNICFENYYIWKEYLLEHNPLKFGEAEIQYFGHYLIYSLYFLKFINPNNECNVVKIVPCIGVGHSIDAEIELKKQYPQCAFLLLDQDLVINVNLIENKLKGILINTTINSKNSYGLRTDAYEVKNCKFLFDYNLISLTIAFFDFFTNYNSKPVIDLLLLDVEGSEPSIFKLLTEQYNQLPVIICQLNVVIHIQSEYLNTFLKQQFLDNFELFINNSKFAMLENLMFKPDELFHKKLNMEIFHRKKCVLKNTKLICKSF
ncbi:Methyltransf_21 domain-containing protein, partial [Meloidogyne graminicola]